MNEHAYEAEAGDHTVSPQVGDAVKVSRLRHAWRDSKKVMTREEIAINAMSAIIVAIGNGTDSQIASPFMKPLGVAQSAYAIADSMIKERQSSGSIVLCATCLDPIDAGETWCSECMPKDTASKDTIVDRLLGERLKKPSRCKQCGGVEDTNGFTKHIAGCHVGGGCAAYYTRREDKTA